MNIRGMKLKCECIISKEKIYPCSKHEMDLLIIGNAFLKLDNHDIIHIASMNHGMEATYYGESEFEKKFPDIKI